MTLATQFVEYANDTSSTVSWEDAIGNWLDDANQDEPVSVLAEIVDTTRWAVVHRQVFKFKDGSHADVHWQAPATEHQDQDPECVWTEVRAEVVATVQYVPLTPKETT